jgi:hypothetical protein
MTIKDKWTWDDHDGAKRTLGIKVHKMASRMGPEDVEMDRYVRQERKESTRHKLVVYKMASGAVVTEPLTGRIKAAGVLRCRVCLTAKEARQQAKEWTDA